MVTLPTPHEAINPQTKIFLNRFVVNKRADNTTATNLEQLKTVPLTPTDQISNLTSPESINKLNRAISNLNFIATDQTIEIPNRGKVTIYNILADGREYAGYFTKNEKFFYLLNKEEVSAVYNGLLKDLGEEDKNGCEDVVSFIDKKSHLIFSYAAYDSESRRERRGLIRHEYEHWIDLNSGVTVSEERAIRAQVRLQEKAGDLEGVIGIVNSRYNGNQDLSLAAARVNPLVVKIKEAIEKLAEGDFSLFEEVKGKDLLECGYVTTNGQMNTSSNEKKKKPSIGLPTSGLQSAKYTKAKEIEVRDSNGEATNKVIELEIEYRVKSNDEVFTQFVVYDPKTTEYQSRESFQVSLIRNEIENAAIQKRAPDLERLKYDGKEIDLLECKYLGPDGLMNPSSNKKRKPLRIGLPVSDLQSVIPISSRYITSTTPPYSEIGLLCQVSGKGSVIRYFGYDGENYFKVQGTDTNINPLKGRVLDLLLYKFTKEKLDKEAQFNPRYEINSFTGEVREPNIEVSNSQWIHAKWGPLAGCSEYLAKLQRAYLFENDRPNPLFLVYREDVLEKLAGYQEELNIEIGIKQDQAVTLQSVTNFVLEHSKEDKKEAYALLSEIRSLEDLDDKGLEKKRDEILEELEIVSVQYEGQGMINLTDFDKWQSHLNQIMDTPEILLEEIRSLDHSLYWEKDYHFQLATYSSYVLGKLRQKELLTDIESQIIAALEDFYPELERDSGYNLEDIMQAMIQAYRGNSDKADDNTAESGGKVGVKPKKFRISDYIDKNLDRIVIAGGDIGASIFSDGLAHPARSIELRENVLEYLQTVEEKINQQQFNSVDEQSETMSVVVGKIKNYLLDKNSEKYTQAEETLNGKGSNVALSTDDMCQILKEFNLNQESEFLKTLTN